MDVWDAGTYSAEKFRDDEVIATMHGRPDGGLGGGPVRLALIRTDRRPRGDDGPLHGEQWLVHRMALEPAPSRRERPRVPGTPAEEGPGPMLAVAGAPLDPDERWVVEMKWDGIRALCRVEGGRVSLTSRNGLDLTPTYPELQALAERVHADAAVLDGEVVALDDRGQPAFSRLQQRMGLTRPQDVERARRGAPVRLFLFDVLQVDGRDVRQAPLVDRRDLLERLVEVGGPVEVPPAVATATGDELQQEVDAAMATSRALGLEGVVVKRADGPYRSGARSADWVKRKHERHQEVVVVGWRPGAGRREGGVGSLLTGVHRDGVLTYAGRVGTGFSDADLDGVAALLRPLEQARPAVADVPRPDAADAHWVAPALVGEVRFAEWTDDGRLRHAAWRGWRPERQPADVVREP